MLGHNYECGHAFLRDLKLVVLRDLKCFAMTKSGSVSGGGPVKEIKRVYYSAVWIIII